MSLWKHYAQPIYEKLLADGVITSYGIDRALYHSTAPGSQTVWALLADAKGLDKLGKAFDDVRAKASEAERAAVDAAFGAAHDFQLHRDGLETVVFYKHK